MTWIAGEQQERDKYSSSINEEILAKKGFLEEREAKLLLYKFLRANTTFAVDMLSGIKLFPFQHMAVKAMLESDYFMGVWSRGMSKSFTTGVFAFLDAILNQGVEIGIISKSFRQSKMIFKKIEDILAKPEAAMLAQCVTRKAKNNDQWTLEIGTSRIHALPLGDGEKLRGFRFHRIIIDEFLLMPERIYNEVIVPFLSVVENPTEREELYNLETKMIEEGRMTEEDRHVWPNNKLIMLSSASYKFEYMYKLYEKFEHLITGQIPEDGNAHRAIMHFSYDCAPQQLYDQNLINQARASMSQSQFDREFGAVFTDDSSGYFKISKMANCTVPDGDNPCVEVAGEPSDEYILSFDPSWAETESSDDFAIQVFKLNNSSKTGTLVHNYALSGGRLKDHIFYFYYLLNRFNIKFIVGDYNGGVQFINACKESRLFKDSPVRFGILATELDKIESYQDSLLKARGEMNTAIENKEIPCILRKPTSRWIREANELLQANFDHKRIFFGARAVNDDYQRQRAKRIPIKELQFLRGLDAQEKQSDAAKMIDFVEHQYDMMERTKAQCALIQIKTTAQGTQTFDLPDNLRRQTGADKVRKDSYSALVLGNWMIKTYYDITNIKRDPVETTFTPMFVA